MTMSRWLVAGLVAVVVFVVLFLRLPEALTRAEFWSDDGAIYTQILSTGPRGIVEPYDNAGYLILLHSAIVYVETLLPPPMAPVLGNVMANVAVAGVAGYAVLARFPWNRKTSVLMALLIPLVPSSFELIGTLSHVLWTIGLWIALVAIAKEPTTPTGRGAETVALVAAGLTGPLSLTFLPLFLFGPRRRLAVMAGTALVQLAVSLVSERVPSVGLDFGLMPYIVLLRGFVTPVLGPTFAWVMPPWLIIASGIVIAMMAAVLLRQLNRRTRWWLVGMAVLVPIAAFARTHYPTEDFLHSYFAPRYFWMTSIAFAWLGLLALKKRQPLALALVVLMTLGVTNNFKQPVRPEMDWETRSQCIGSTSPCVVPVPTNSDPLRWAVLWLPQSR